MIRTSFPLLTIRGRRLLPVIQGGMGVGVSGHRLAGAVGTVASVDLRRLHPDIMQRLRKCHDPAIHSAANIEALDREIRAAHALAPDGFVARNRPIGRCFFKPWIPAFAGMTTLLEIFP